MTRAVLRRLCQLGYINFNDLEENYYTNDFLFSYYLIDVFKGDLFKIQYSHFWLSSVGVFRENTILKLPPPPKKTIQLLQILLQ